ATPARPGNGPPASPPHGDGSRATAAPGPDPSPTPLWPPHGTARPRAAGAPTRPAPTAASAVRSDSQAISSAGAGRALGLPRSTSPGAVDRRSSPANTAGPR